MPNTFRTDLVYKRLCFTNERPIYDNCSVGADSWCKWCVAEAVDNQNEFQQLLHLYPDVQKHISSIYKDLSKKVLLEQGERGWYSAQTATH